MAVEPTGRGRRGGGFARGPCRASNRGSVNLQLTFFPISIFRPFCALVGRGRGSVASGMMDSRVVNP